MGEGCYLPSSHLLQPSWTPFPWHYWNAPLPIICPTKASRSSAGAPEAFAGVVPFVRLGSRPLVGPVSRNDGHGTGRGRWEVAFWLGTRSWSCSSPGQGRPSSASAAQPQRVPLALGKKRLFWASLKELAAEEGNGPGSGRQMCKLQRGRVESRRKSLIYGYDLVCV